MFTATTIIPAYLFPLQTTVITFTIESIPHTAFRVIFWNCKFYRIFLIEPFVDFPRLCSSDFQTLRFLALSFQLDFEPLFLLLIPLQLHVFSLTLLNVITSFGTPNIHTFSSLPHQNVNNYSSCRYQLITWSNLPLCFSLISYWMNECMEKQSILHFFYFPVWKSLDDTINQLLFNLYQSFLGLGLWINLHFIALFCLQSVFPHIVLFDFISTYEVNASFVAV